MLKSPKKTHEKEKRKPSTSQVLLRSSSFCPDLSPSIPRPENFLLEGAVGEAREKPGLGE
jgi:hypothetical protein